MIAKMDAERLNQFLSQANHRLAQALTDRQSLAKAMVEILRQRLAEFKESPMSKAVLFLIIVGSAVSASAQAVPTHPRDLSFGPLHFDPPTPAEYRHTLSNGVVTFVVEDHSLPLVTVSVVVRTGGYLEPVEKFGLANLTGSQMRTGGTASLTPSEFDEEAAFLAVQLTSNIGDTNGRASVNSLTKDLDMALDLFFDMLRYPRFDQGRLDLGKSQMLQRMGRRNDSTTTIEGREWGRLLRGDDHFTTRLMTKASVESITQENLIAFHERYYYPGGFIFSVSGDVTPETILPKLEAWMDGWSKRDDVVLPVPKPTYAPVPGLYTIDKPDVNQGRVSIGHLGTTRDNPDRYALTVMNEILGGGGFSARLLTRIRSDEGLAYSAYSRFGIGTYYEGAFRASFQSRSAAVTRASALVLEEINRIRSELVSKEELENSIASFVETFTRNFSSARAIATLFSNDEYTGRDPEYLISYRGRISAVTAEDVLRVAQEYLKPDKLLLLVIGNLEAIESGDLENPDYSLDGLVRGVIRRIPLPDPFTMKYPSEP